MVCNKMSCFNLFSLSTSIFVSRVQFCFKNVSFLFDSLDMIEFVHGSILSIDSPLDDILSLSSFILFMIFMKIMKNEPEFHKLLYYSFLLNLYRRVHVIFFYSLSFRGNALQNLVFLLLSRYTQIPV